MTTDDIEAARPTRAFEELRTHGLLWLINTTVFHPRGYALALQLQDGVATGWRLLGDGSEPWTFGETLDAEFAASEAFLARHASTGIGDEPVFAIRAQDGLALDIIAAYAEACRAHRLDRQAGQVDLAYAEVANWQAANPLRVKLPDHDHRAVRSE